jgi:hypothetical protein
MSLIILKMKTILILMKIHSSIKNLRNSFNKKMKKWELAVTQDFQDSINRKMIKIMIR